MDTWLIEFLKSTPADIIVVALATILLFLLLVPLVLRLAGLKPDQIVDVLKTTLQLFLALIKEYRAQNKSNS